MRESLRPGASPVKRTWRAPRLMLIESDATQGGTGNMSPIETATPPMTGKNTAPLETSMFSGPGVAGAS